MEYNATEIANYVDDTTPYTHGQSFDDIIEKLEMDMSKIFELLHHKGFKANPGKFHFLLSQFVDRPIKILGSTIKTSK